MCFVPSVFCGIVENISTIRNIESVSTCLGKGRGRESEKLFSLDSFATPWTVALPGSSAHGLSQARILEWVAISFFRESLLPRDGTCISCFGRQILYH